MASDDTVPENIDLKIVYEDDSLVVVNKPPGMVVHPARGIGQGRLPALLPTTFNRCQTSAVQHDLALCIDSIVTPAV